LPAEHQRQVLAAVLADRGKQEKGRALLQPVVDHFVEGFETADLTAAKSLLSKLG